MADPAAVLIAAEHAEWFAEQADRDWERRRNGTAPDVPRGASTPELRLGCRCVSQLGNHGVAWQHPYHHSRDYRCSVNCCVD